MATKEINKTKILVKVHEPLIEIMQHKIEAACLKRDAYLDKALQVEAEFLREEIVTPNSDMAKSYIVKQLVDLKLKPLNLLLSTQTVDLINEVCKEKNVPRDAFINRFFLLLIANNTILTALLSEFLEEDGNSETIDEFLDYNDWSQLDMDTSVRIEYLFATHNAIDAIEDSISEYSPFIKVRSIVNKIASDNQDSENISQYENAMYSYPFSKEALKNLPNDYDLLKLDNALAFNPFMLDEDLLDDSLSIPDGKKDKLVKIMKKEKKLQLEKEENKQNKEKQKKSKARVKGEQK